MKLLSIENISATYGGIHALRAVNLHVDSGEVVSVLGPNGAGKSTLLRVISGLVKPEPGGVVSFHGRSLIGVEPYKIARQGIAHVPEGRQIFPDLSVDENLEVAGVRIDAGKRKTKTAEVYELFTELATRKKQIAGSLSGGEQQMLAIGRALVSDCELIMIDEPSMGLAPVIVMRIFKTLRDIMESKGLTLLIVEQNARLSLQLSDRVYVLSQGEITLDGPVDLIKEDEEMRELYFATEK